MGDNTRFASRPLRTSSRTDDAAAEKGCRMSISVNWKNPYEDRRGQWYTGTLHTHTSPASKCGKVAVERVLELYAQAGFDFLAISDHMAFTSASHPEMVMIPGVEWNSAAGEHTGIFSLDPAVLEHAIGISDQEALLAWLADRDAMVVLNHPNWQLKPHYRREQLAVKGPYDGIEIFNNVIERLDGYAIATDKWDYLLASGKKVLGFASDDFHQERDVGWGKVVVRSASRDAAGLLDAIRRGNFYCSSGVTINDIRREGNRVTVESHDAQEIQAIGQGGKLIERRFAAEMAFEIPETCGTYVRFALYGQGSAMAWTQPFFLA